MSATEVQTRSVEASHDLREPDGKTQRIRINIGCGSSPTAGWLNYDNSITVRLARWPILGKLVFQFVGSQLTKGFARSVAQRGIRWADATRYIPLPDNSVEVLYTSHMVEHLDQEEVRTFLDEVKRVLVSEGIIRVVIPDLRKLIDRYAADPDADVFIRSTRLAFRRPKSLLDKIRFLIVGPREHLWMYDGESFVGLLAEMGFNNSRILQPGQTSIADPGDLDLFERESESVYLEARKP